MLSCELIHEVPLWQVLELTSESNTVYDNPFQEVSFSATFTGPSGLKTVRGFCDGEKTWKIRFMPDVEGEWIYTTASNDPELNGRSGRFRCVASKARGPHWIDLEHPGWFRYANGDPCLIISDTVYNLFTDAATLEERKAFLNEAASYGINRIRVKVGDMWSALRRNSTGFPFERFSDTYPDYDRYNLLHFREAEELIRYSAELGVIVSVILHVGERMAPGDKVPATDDQWRNFVRYVIARWAAFPNIEWQMENEYGHPLQEVTTFENFRDFVELVRREDPYNRIIGSQFYEPGWPFYNQSLKKTEIVSGEAVRRYYELLDIWLFEKKCKNDPITHHRTAVEQAALARAMNPPRPAVYEEISYEQDPEHLSNPSNGSTPENIRKFLWGTLVAACSFTYGAGPDRWAGFSNEVSSLPNDERLIGKCSLKKEPFNYQESGYRFFIHARRFFEGIPFCEMEGRDDLILPAENLPPAWCLAKEGKEYVIYAPEGGRFRMKLSEGIFSARWYDPVRGRYKDGYDVAGGRDVDFVCPDSIQDWVLHLRRKYD